MLTQPNLELVIWPRQQAAEMNSTHATTETHTICVRQLILDIRVLKKGSKFEMD